jgi:UDP-N-acetylglucosamine acyltransferase
MSVDIHQTAIVHKKANIGSGTKIGPYCIVGEHVTVGENTVLHSHVVIQGHTELGAENQIFPFSSLGGTPQDLKYSGEDSRLVIGSKNIIREYVTLQPGTSGGGMLTQVGNGNLFMAQSHVAHDVILGDGNILANSVALAGHITVGSRVIIAGLSGVHQFVRLGDLSYIAAGSMVSKDVPPFAMAQGDRAGLVGLNSVGLKRAGFSDEDIRLLKTCFRNLYYSTTGQSLFKDRIAELLVKSKDSLSQSFLNFIVQSKRGVCSLRESSSDSISSDSVSGDE